MIVWSFLLFLAMPCLVVGQEEFEGCQSFERATELIEPLLELYNPATGMWKETVWWTSANHLTALADYIKKAPFTFPQYKELIENTFLKCQEFSMIHNHNDVKTLERLRASSPVPAVPMGFVNEYYDDDGWWALVWIKLFDITADSRYLEAAVFIFEHMSTGWSEEKCGGGVPWTLSTSYKNAISNELFLQVAASLANRIPENSTYLEWADKEWNWFDNSKMWNDEGTVNDGLTDDCENNNEPVWSYNQGVLLGALVELHKVKQDPYLLMRAHSLAEASINALSQDNVLHDICEPNCNNGGSFKGIFVRNLAALNEYTPDHNYTSFLQANADSLWDNNRNEQNHVGMVWSGPFAYFNEVSQSAGLDCLNAVINCSSKPSELQPPPPPSPPQHQETSFSEPLPTLPAESEELPPPPPPPPPAPEELPPPLPAALEESTQTPSPQLEGNQEIHQEQQATSHSESQPSPPPPPFPSPEPQELPQGFPAEPLAPSPESSVDPPPAPPDEPHLLPYQPINYPIDPTNHL